MDVRLQIVKQESVTQDVTFVNGQTKVVHSCIKGSPFKLELALVGTFDPHVVNFNRFVITAVLLYDHVEGRGDERQVSFVKTRPLEVLEYGVNDTGDRLTLVVVLHVLSSQHEHSLFLIKIANADLGLVAVSQPIRVVSKELQLKGKTKPRKTSAAPSSTAARRPHMEEVVQYLQRIESQSQTHHQLLLSILQHLAANEEGVASAGAPQLQPAQQQQQLQKRSASLSGEGVPGEPAAKRQKRDLKELSSTPAPFEESFDALVRSFGALPREQRTDTVRRAVRACPDRETMSDLLGHLAAAGMMGSFGLANHHPGANAAGGGGGASFDATSMSLLPSMAMMRQVKSEPPSSDLGDQILDLGLPPRAPSLPYMPAVVYDGSVGGMMGMVPGQSGDETERKELGTSLDTNKLYNDLFATWPYDNLGNNSNSNGLSQ
jgi:hypothetical protein